MHFVSTIHSDRGPIGTSCAYVSKTRPCEDLALRPFHRRPTMNHLNAATGTPEAFPRSAKILYYVLCYERHRRQRFLRLNLQPIHLSLESPARGQSPAGHTHPQNASSRSGAYKRGGGRVFTISAHPDPSSSLLTCCHTLAESKQSVDKLAESCSTSCSYSG